MALEVTNEIQSTASNQTVAQAKYIADDDFMTDHSTTNNKQNTINEWLANHDKTYKLTLNGTTNGDGNNGEDLGSFYAPTSFGAANKLLLAQGENAAPVWSSFNLSTGVLRFDDGWDLTSLQSLNSTDANRPILTRCTNLANNTGDRDHSYFSGKAFLNHSTGALTLDKDGVRTVLKPDSSIPFELSQLVDNNYVPITNKIVTSNGLITAPDSSGQVLLSNNNYTPIWQTLTLANLSDWPTPLSTDLGKVLVVTGQNNLNWTPLYNYSFSINTSGTASSVNQITITKSYDGQTYSTTTLTPKLFYKNSTTASGVGTPVDIRLYKGDNITFTEIDEDGTGARTGIKISANVTTIPKATSTSLGGIKLKSNTTISSVNNPISGNAYPIQLTSDGVAGVVFSISTIDLANALNQLVNEARNNPSLRTQLASFFTGLTNITEQTFRDIMGTAFNTILSWYSPRT